MIHWIKYLLNDHLRQNVISEVNSEFLSLIRHTFYRAIQKFNARNSAFGFFIAQWYGRQSCREISVKERWLCWVFTVQFNPIHQLSVFFLVSFSQFSHSTGRFSICQKYIFPILSALFSNSSRIFLRHHCDSTAYAIAAWSHSASNTFHPFSLGNKIPQF